MPGSEGRGLVASVLVTVLSQGCGGTTTKDPPRPALVPTCHAIEFDDLEVEDGAQIVDPYVDPETGVIFTGLDPAGDADVLVGLRADARTCPSDRDPGNMLVATVGSEENLGRTAYPIVATFPAPLAPPVTVTVEVLSPVGPLEPPSLRLMDAQGREVAVAAERIQPTLWPCPFWWPSASGLVRLRAQAEVEVTSAVLQAPPSYIAWWDHFVYSEGAPADLDGCHSLDTGIPDAQLCPVNDGTADYQCVPRPPGVPTCNDCDVECLRAGIQNFIESERICTSLPTEIRCGPNPDETEGCCYVAKTEAIRTCPLD